jgi:hypothetical protein
LIARQQKHQTVIPHHKPTAVEEIVIGSAGSQVVFSKPSTPNDGGWRSFRVKLQAPGLLAEEVVADHVGFGLPDGRTGTNGLQELIASTAKEYKGWSGTKRWVSLEAQLRIEATSDRTGHATFLFSLGQMLGAGWNTTLQITLDVMERERLAGQLRSFFESREK